MAGKKSVESLSHQTFMFLMKTEMVHKDNYYEVSEEIRYPSRSWTRICMMSSGFQIPY